MLAVLAKIAAIVFFTGSAGMVAVALGYLAHETFYVPRGTIRENALILAVLITALVIV